MLLSGAVAQVAFPWEPTVALVEEEPVVFAQARQRWRQIPIRCRSGGEAFLPRLITELRALL